MSRPLSEPQVEVLRLLGAGQYLPEGRAVLPAAALVRRGLAEGAGSGVIGLTPAGWRVLARIQSRNPDLAKRVRTVHTGFRLPETVLPALERGKAKHGTASLAVAHALLLAFPECVNSVLTNSKPKR